MRLFLWFSNTLLTMVCRDKQPQFWLREVCSPSNVSLRSPLFPGLSRSHFSSMRFSPHTENWRLYLTYSFFTFGPQSTSNSWQLRTEPKSWLNFWTFNCFGSRNLIFEKLLSERVVAVDSVMCTLKLLRSWIRVHASISDQMTNWVFRTRIKFATFMWT